MNWWQISIVLSTYGVFKEYRPSEPFITPYLTIYKNFTSKQINENIYPLGTYFHLCLLVMVFLLTDYLKYKAVLVAGGISAIITWTLLIFGKTLSEMQVVEFFYGVFMASEVAYFTYIYAKVDKIHYQKVTSYSRTAFLLGKASAGLSSQLFVDLKVLNYLELNYLTVAGVSIATFATFFLPSVSKSIYFHSNEHKTNELNIEIQPKGNENKIKEKVKTNVTCRYAFNKIYDDFKEAFTNRYVLQWSIWWALATSGFLQVISYCQLLWEDIVQQDNSTFYHGYVECATSLLGAAVTFCIGYLKISWNLWGEISLGALTILQGCFLFYCAHSSKLYIAYILHIAYQIFYHAAITVANYEVAKFIKEQSYALVFGINTFLALLLQTGLTAIVIDFLKTNIRNQFVVYSRYHICIGVGFLCAGTITLMSSKKAASTNHV